MNDTNNAAELVLQARRAGLRFEVDGSKLTIRGPRTEEALAKQLLDRHVEVIAALAAEQEAELVAALGHTYELQAAWRGVCVELGELLGWPRLPFAAGRSVAPGRSGWYQFVRLASVPDLELVRNALVERVAALPGPETSEVPR